MSERLEKRIEKLERQVLGNEPEWKKREEEILALLKEGEELKKTGFVYEPLFNSAEELRAWCIENGFIGDKIWDPVRKGYYYMKER